MLTVNLLPKDTPLWKTSVVIGSDPLNTVHMIVKLSTTDDWIVMLCPHVKSRKDGKITGGTVGGTRCGSPMYKG